MSLASTSAASVLSTASNNAFAPAALLHLREAVLSNAIVEQVKQYRDHKSQLVRFLEEFETPHETGPHGKRTYMNRIQALADGEANVLTIDLNDIDAFFKDGSEKLDGTLPSRIARNTQRYIRIFYQAVELIREHLPAADSPITMEDLVIGEFERGHGRTDLMRAANVPVHLRLPYEVRIKPSASSTVFTVRELRGRHLGALVRVEGVVMKVTAVRPRLLVAYYRCIDCHADCHQPVGPVFTPLVSCDSPACAASQKRGELRMIIQESKFVKYQEVQIQEPSDRVPTGCIPRSQRVIVEGSLTRRILPGMRVVMAGLLIPLPKTPQQQYRKKASALITETAFYVHSIVIDKNEGRNRTGELLQKAPAPSPELHSLLSDPQIYERLAFSLAPGIHGMQDVKKTLLLQLIGGVPGSFTDGMQVRGDIHVLLMGDPGVAKSQLLGQICRIAPRAHYATGKGSSGVGLTAAVVRDPHTGDLTLEGGAIVLSDRGLCCIDEFDKMDEYDRTAIHEVMEQQTVSISKAGLTTTLNARASILAAANPQYGRYDITKTPMQNVNLPAALLSRFDVVFLLLDRADREADATLARHVLKVHQQNAAKCTGPAESESSVRADFTEKDALPETTIRSLVAEAKRYHPVIPDYLMQEIVEYYVELRQKEKDCRNKATASLFSYTTPRTLLGILRLAQAHARLRLGDIVDRGDFEEALRLMIESRRSILEEEESGKKRRRRQDVEEVLEAEILDLMKSLDAKNRNGIWLPMMDVEDACSRMGFTRDQVLRAIAAYEELGVLIWRDEESKREIGFVERVESA